MSISSSLNIINNQIASVQRSLDSADRRADTVVAYANDLHRQRVRLIQVLSDLGTTIEKLGDSEYAVTLTEQRAKVASDLRHVRSELRRQTTLVIRLSNSRQAWRNERHQLMRTATALKEIENG